MGQIKMIQSFVLIAIFSIAIIVFAVQFAEDNDSDISLTGDTRWSNLNSSVQGDIPELESDAQTSSGILFNTTLEAGDQSASSGGQFKVGPVSSMKIAFKSITGGFSVIFGSDNEFSFILMALGSVLFIMVTL